MTNKGDGMVPVRIGGAVILLVFLLGGFVIKPHMYGKNFENENLWAALHPASALNILGVVLVIGCIMFLTGIINWILRVTFTMPPNSSWIPIAGVVAGVVGVLLCFA